MDVATASFSSSIHHSLYRRRVSRVCRFQKNPAANCRRLSHNENKVARCIRSTLTTDTSNAAPATELPALTGQWKSSSLVVERGLLRETELPKFQKIETNDEEDAFWDYQFLYKSQRNEVDSIPLTLVEGTIPPTLSGVYYLCGPGIRSDDHGSQVHPLDGHGYLRKFVIDGSNPVIYSAKYVNTDSRKEEYDDENKTWRFQYRGPFSQLRGGNRVGNVKVMKNVANTSVLEWAGKLMCMYEGGHPYELDPTTLQTLGLFNVSELSSMDTNFVTKHAWTTLKDTCTNLSSLVGSARRAAVEFIGLLIQPVLKGVYEMPAERMLSHVKMDIKRQRLVVMTCRREDMVLPKSTFTVYEMDLSMQVVQRKTFTLDEQLMIHDWGLTDNHYVLLANRVKLNSPARLAESVAGLQPMINCLALDDKLPYTPMYLLPRETNVTNSSRRDWRTPVKVPEQLWFVHTANSFEETDDDGNCRITLDGTACTYEWFSLMHMFGYKWQNRWLDPNLMNKLNGGTTHSEKCSVQLIRVSTLLSTEGDEIETKCEKFEKNKRACEFPAIHPKLYGSRNEHTYLVSTSGRRKALPHFPFDTVLKISGDAPDGKVQSWWAGSRNFVGEPTFVPRAGSAPPGSPDFVEDDGYVIVVQYAAAEEVCYLVILDARLIGGENPVVARLQLPAKYAFPYGFHGFWTDVNIKHT